MTIKINNKQMNVKICSNFTSRLKGLMFNKKKIDYILCFPKCNSIHTFFMFQKINVIMTDKNNKILYIFKNIKPWRIILPKKNVYYTYELTENIDKLKIEDKLKEV